MGDAKEWKYRQTHKDAFAGVMPEVELYARDQSWLQAADTDRSG